MTTTTTTDYDAEAVRLSAGIDPATVADVWMRTGEMLRARCRATTIDSAAWEGRAIGRALRMLSGAESPLQAMRQAVTTTFADAVAAEAVAAVSLDVTLDTYGDVSERWSAYDDGAGIYRGVSRQPMPTDCLRADVPNPGTVADAAMSTLADPYRRALSACLAVNVAAESQRVAHVAALAEYVATAERDAAQAVQDSRTGRAAIIRRAVKVAQQERRNVRADSRTASTYRPRAQEVTAALGLSDTGRNRVATGEALTLANDAYWEARAAIVSDALAQHADALTTDAEARREAYRLAGGHTVAPVTYAPVQHADPLGYVAPRTSGDRPRRIGTFDAVSSYGSPVNGSPMAALAQADSRTTTDLPSAARHGESAADSPMTSTCGGAPTIG